MRFQTILVPIVFKEHPRHILQQAAWLARRFDAEIILVHVVASMDYPAGIFESGDAITAHDLHSRAVQRAEEELNREQPEFGGIKLTRLLLRGNPAHEIVTAARDRKADLIVMPTHDFGRFFEFLLGSVVAKVLHDSPCPVWTGAHLEGTPEGPFSIRHVLCAVDLMPRSNHTVSIASGLATAVGAALTLVHVTPSVEMYGPGGSHTDYAWKEALVGAATKEMENLQRDMNLHAGSIVESGDVRESLNRAAQQTHADVLVTGHSAGRGHLGGNSNGYAIIQSSRIPVLSV